MKYLYQTDYPYNPDLILGAIIGDCLGSPYEFPDKDAETLEPFELLHPEACYTDDTVMTVAVMDWLLRAERYNLHDINKSKELGNLLADILREYYYKYPHAGYGGRIRKWFRGNDMFRDSFGNGSAMRVSPVSWWACTPEEAYRLAVISAQPTHCHPDGVEGAVITALAGYYARTLCGSNPQFIIQHTLNNEFRKSSYFCDWTLNDIKKHGYHFDATCQGSVPEALICFIEGKDVVGSLQNAVDLRGDTDTMAAIACGIAECYNGTLMTPENVRKFVWKRLPDEFKDVITTFTRKVAERIRL